MAFHRIFNSGADAVITGDDGSLWEAGDVRYLEYPDRGWLSKAVAAGILVDLGRADPPKSAKAAASKPVPPETTDKKEGSA